jgi:hypothetical protein
MMRDAIASLGSQASAQRFRDYGQAVTFRGQTITAIVSPGNPTLDLELGGGRERGTVRIQLPSTVNPRPEPKESIFIINEGRKVRIETARIAPPAGGGVWMIDAYDSGEY